MTHISGKSPLIRRLGFGLLLIGLPLLVLGLMEYQKGVARDRAAELEAFCAAPSTGVFSLKLACIARRDQ